MANKAGSQPQQPINQTELRPHGALLNTMVVFNISLNSSTPSPPPPSETSHDSTTSTTNTNPPPEPYNYYHSNCNGNMNHLNHWIAVPGNPRPVHIQEVRRNMDEAQFGRCTAPNTDCHNRPVQQLINGAMRRSQYCEFHHCQFVEDGRLCATAKPPRNERFCNDRKFWFRFTCFCRFS